MHRFFVNLEQIRNNQVLFNSNESKQIRNVLRLSARDIILVLDNEGNVYTVEISDSDKKTLKGNIIEKKCQKLDSKLNISFGQSLIKGSKIDFIVQKATELGIGDITLIETERSIIKYKDVEAKNRVDRWNKIAKEAAEQSHRITLPTVSCCRSLKDFCVVNKDAELKLVLWEEEKEKRLRDCFENDMDISRLAFLVGPEGGFSKKEVDLVSESGFVPVGLGSRILKTETAAISILSIIQYVKGELG